jgi:outer membrane protein OmpA-like peptidoglycan-associated protein
MREIRCIVFTVIAAAGNCFLLQAQNLVPNPGFEEYSNCPGNFSEAVHEFRVNNWQSATMGTPDHFNSCSNGEADVPYNWAGVSDAYEGKGYAGIYLWMDNRIDYREYLQCKLNQILLKDTLYRIEFRYKLSSYSKYSVDRIGLLLASNMINKHSDRVIETPPTLSVIQDSALTKTTGLWEKASMEYKASGNENYLIIGNFFDNQSTKKYYIEFRPAAQPMLANSAYYYIDDVKVIPKYPEEKQLLPEFNLEETTLNKTYVLKNIQFELNSYRLTSPSFQELDLVADYLYKYPKVNVQISGHTDDQGSADYNLKLSRNRAKNAGAYLESLGINKSRIETFGYGKTRPLVESTTEEARAVNRRVEIRFVQ